MRILVLASDNPSPPINGTRIRNFHLWREMRSLGHEVKILAITRNPSDLSSSSEEIEFFRFTKKSLFKRIWMRLFHSYHEWPVSDDLDKRTQNLLADWKPDVIHAEELRMGRYIPKTKILTSLCLHNVERDLILKTKAAPFKFGITFFNWIYWVNLCRFEREQLNKVKVRFTYSERDKLTYQEHYPNLTFHTSSNGVNLLEETTISEDPSKLLFLGSLSYLPNIEGLFWFVDKVMPKIKNRINFRVAGSTPTREVKKKLLENDIKLFDTPLELSPIYADTSLMIVPLLNGSGTRGKILESLMYGRSVLTTAKGVEGLNLTSDDGIILANTETEFAEAIDEWISKTIDARTSLSKSGRETVVARYTWKSVALSLLSSWKQSL